MVATSREARSARREALRKQSQTSSASTASKPPAAIRSTPKKPQSRVVKQPSSSPKKPRMVKGNIQAAMMSAVKAAKKRPSKETKSVSNVLPSAAVEEQISEEVTAIKDLGTEEPTESPLTEGAQMPETPENVDAAVRDLSKVATSGQVIENMSTIPSLDEISIPDAGEILNFEEVTTPSSGTPDLLTPSSPLTDQLVAPISPASELDEMSDDDLQKYLSEFEAASQGEYPDPEPTPQALLSPELDATDKAIMEYNKPMSPLMLETTDLSAPFDNFSGGGILGESGTVPALANGPPSGQSNDDLRMEEYITYGDNNTTDSMDVGAEQIMSNQRRAPFCIYRPRPQTSPVSYTFNPNKRTLLAAWETVAADFQHNSREDYMQSVILAAASLNHRSMVTGLARQTMAPALGTSH